MEKKKENNVNECACNCQELIRKIQVDALRLRTLQELIGKQPQKIEYINCKKKTFYNILPN